MTVTHGSIYPGASDYQDWDYAARVAARQKAPTEAAAPEPAAVPPLTNTPARRRKERK